MELSEIVDRLAIQDLLATYCERIDAYDVEGATEGFLETCTIDFGPVFEGRAALRDHIARSQARFVHVHHQLGQVLVRLDGDEASSIAYATATHHHAGGGFHQSFIQYHDRWLRTSEGWRISRRQAYAGALDRDSLLEGPGSPAHWVPRGDDAKREDLG